MSTPSHARSAVLVWLTLVCATVASWWLVEHHLVQPQLATTAVLVIAAIKARLVFLNFMELAGAPLAWRAVLEVWAALVAGMLIAGYWFAMS
jgi:hypothetical protein